MSRVFHSLFTIERARHVGGPSLLAIRAVARGFESLLSHQKSFGQTSFPQAVRGGFCSFCAPLLPTPKLSEVNIGWPNDVRVAAAGAAPPAPHHLIIPIPLDAPGLPAQFALELQNGTVVAHDGNAHRLRFMRECRVESRFHLPAPLLPGLLRVASGKRMEMTVPPAFAASFGSAAS